MSLAKTALPYLDGAMSKLVMFCRAAGVSLSLAAGGVAPAVWAHHSWARYDNDHVVTKEGVLTAVQFENPHVVMRFTSAGANGQAAEWTMEMDPPTLLLRFGLRHDTFKPGMAVKITGVLARSGATMMRAVTIETEDGTVYRVSSRV